MSKNAHDALMTYLDKEDAHMRAVGLGELNDQTLLLEAARSLAFIGEESFAYTLANHARRKGSKAWSSDPKVVPALARGAADGDRFAQELLNRTRGKLGQYEQAAAAEYWRMKVNEYREAGNDAAAELCERIAAKPDGGRDLLTKQPGKPTHRGTLRAQRRLDDFNAATSKLIKGSDAFTDAVDRLAQAEGKSRKDYYALIAKAQKRRADLLRAE